MSREAFEADAAPYGFDLMHQECAAPEPWSEYADEATGHRWAGWQAAIAWAYENAARVCDGMHPEVWPSAYAEAIRERAKEVGK